MLDQLIIEGKESLVDFSASVKESSTNPPEKKVIKETVPFSNVTYDFSAINGELYWEERKLEYIFEITADTPQELEQKKSAFASWVMAVQNAKIYDPYIEDFHFVGTFDSIKYDDEEHKEKTTATVVFSAYPYKVANEPKLQQVLLEAGEEKIIYIANESSHRITPTIISDVAATIEMGNISYSVPSGKTTDDDFMFETGAIQLLIRNTDSVNGSIIFSYSEEVF
jgi:hypothetical protein